MKTKIFQKKYFLLFVFFMLLVCVAEARFGGGGGGHSGGGGHYSGGGGHYSSGGHHSGGGKLSAPVAILLIFVFIVAVIAEAFNRRNRDDESYYSSINRIKKGFMKPVEKADALSKIKDLNEQLFLEKIKIAFSQVQESWAQKNTALTRRFISDGMYQRVHAQFLMMNKIGQINTIESVKLNSCSIAFVERTEPYDIVYVEFKAYINEKYTHPEFPVLKHAYNENFTEYWTFIRKTGAQGGDLYKTVSCPNCGHSLAENLGEVSRCPSCKTYTNTGEFDWVISEVIQPEEFVRMMDDRKYYRSIASSIEKIKPVFPELNLPVMEDKAANAFLQVKIAWALNDLQRIKRFSSDIFFKQFSSNLPTPYLYNRLYLRKAAMINLFDDETHYYAAFQVKWTEQKIRINDGRLTVLDQTLKEGNQYLVLNISKQNKISHHSVLDHACTHCGGILNDTVDLTCPYCGHALNDDTRDWIVYGLYDYAEFSWFKNTFKTSPKVAGNIEQKIASPQMQLRDYALNNMLVILNADGQLTTDEKKFAVKMAKLLKYKNEELNILWQEGASEKMGISMPEDKKQQQKVYNLMKKAAKADKQIGTEEQAILNDVKNKYALKD